MSDGVFNDVYEFRGTAEEFSALVRSRLLQLDEETPSCRLDEGRLQDFVSAAQTMYLLADSCGGVVGEVVAEPGEVSASISISVPSLDASGELLRGLIGVLSRAEQLDLSVDSEDEIVHLDVELDNVWTHS